MYKQKHIKNHILRYSYTSFTHLIYVFRYVKYSQIVRMTNCETYLYINDAQKSSTTTGSLSSKTNSGLFLQQCFCEGSVGKCHYFSARLRCCKGHGFKTPIQQDKVFSLGGHFSQFDWMVIHYTQPNHTNAKKTCIKNSLQVYKTKFCSCFNYKSVFL